MVENLETIKLMDKKFKFVQRRNEKLIYQSIDKELEEVTLLELEIDENEKRIKKIDIFSFQDEEVSESIHISRGIDGITEIDYFPTEEEYVSIDGDKKLYNINIFRTYSETDSSYPELYEVQLTRKGHKKHKFLTKTTDETIYLTKNNNSHEIKSQSINRLKRLTTFLTPSIIEIERSLFDSNYKKTIEVEPTEEVSIEPTLDYPLSLFVYDRDYSLVGIKNDVLIYRSTEGEIQELEVYFDATKTKIPEIRFVNYEESYIEGIRNFSKKKIVRIQTISNNKVKATLVNRKKESMIINGHTLDKAILRVNAIVEETSVKTKVIEENLDIRCQGVNLLLKKSPTRRINFVDENGEEYSVLTSSHVFFDMLIVYGPGLINVLEKRLIADQLNNEKEKKLLMKN